MAYISKEDVSLIRKRLKEEFGNRFKFSVTTQNHSKVSVAIMSGEIADWSDFVQTEHPYGHSSQKQADIDRLISKSKAGYVPINEFYIDDTWKGKGKDIFNTILDSCQVGDGCHNRNAEDLSADYSDYTYFIDISVGKWDKPYFQKATAPIIASTLEDSNNLEISSTQKIKG